MRPLRSGLSIAGIALLTLTGCGGGGGGGGASNPPAPVVPNVAPIANSGANQTVNSGAIVTLNGLASSDADGSVAGYGWTQTNGTPAISLLNASSSQPSFTAPTLTTASTLTFSLVVTDNDGAASAPATVQVTVNPVLPGNAVITGRVTFERVPFRSTSPFGLDYANPVQRPARAVRVRALNATTQSELATATTNTEGDYSLVVPDNTSVVLQVLAHMLRDSSQAPPRWDMRAQNGAGGEPYVHVDGAAFNSAAGVTRNVNIPTGVNADGTAGGTRASAPFAVLDTVYQAMQTILAVAPSIEFPTLVLDWADDNPGSETFFTTNGAQRIVLSADLEEDTDEFDQHVVAHEFGHYIEHNFSRADSIGGAHGLGDRLDIRTAFGEGFGYAFAAIVLSDPIARDSFVNAGGTSLSGSFNVETNPATNPPATPGDSTGCWCSESSVWSILWDLHDDNADANDTLALGFAPIWDVLINAQRTTPAFTSVFSFISALKAARPADAAAINALVAAQNIDAANIDAYASNETHFPAQVAGAAALPLYTSITLGGAPVVVRSVDDAGLYNKLGNHRFLRFNVPSSRPVTITVSSSNPSSPDPDFRLWRAGSLVINAEGPPSVSETATQTLVAGDYVLDVYECANGCSVEQGTRGDFDLTVTIN